MLGEVNEAKFSVEISDGSMVIACTSCCYMKSGVGESNQFLKVMS